MEMKGYHTIFPEKAQNETRSITLMQDVQGVPKGEYIFYELYCTDPTCDCRRAMIRVSSDKREVEATLSYGWENRQFYAKWMGADDITIDDMPGVNVYALQQQNTYYLEIYEMFKRIIEHDPAYARRLKDHYDQVKAQQRSLLTTPVSIKTGKKIGRNEPCHCGSGKKAKKCCLNQHISL